MQDQPLPCIFAVYPTTLSMTQSSQFNGTIGLGNLLNLVRNTAPFLFDPAFGFPQPIAGGRLIDLGNPPYGWLDILHAADELPATPHPTSHERQDYFALCLACHHATVATFVPTDVDGKIRGVLWQQRMDPASRRRIFDLVLNALKWDLFGISTRTTELSGVGPVSGHNGEMLGVMAGALGKFLQHGDEGYTYKAVEAIDAELNREAHEFAFALKQPGGEIDVLRLAASLTTTAVIWIRAFRSGLISRSMTRIGNVSDGWLTKIQRPMAMFTKRLRGCTKACWHRKAIGITPCARCAVCGVRPLFCFRWVRFWMPGGSASPRIRRSRWMTGRKSSPRY